MAMQRPLGSVLVLCLVSGATLGIACSGGGAPPVAAPYERATPVARAAKPSEQPPPVACAAKPAGLETILRPGAVVVFGEVHGTVETPAFVANVACHAAQSGADVAVGLEIPHDLQPQLDRFLDSSGGPDDVTALLQGEHWNVQDGNASKALFGVMEQVRTLRHSGKKARVFFFDRASTDSGNRDQNMAASIAAQADKNTQGITLVLTGNLHARADSERWMSWHIARRYPGLRTLNVGYSGGSAYVCLMGSECGVRTDLVGKDRGNSPFIEVFAAPDAKGYGGLFYIGGAVTPSPPVKHEGPMKVLPLPLRQQASKAYDAKDYKACAKLFTDSAAENPGPAGASDLYSAACCDSLGGDHTAALARLEGALDRGFVNVAHMTADPDLAGLHAHAGWKPLLAKAKARAKTAASAPPVPSAPPH